MPRYVFNRTDDPEHLFGSLKPCDDSILSIQETNFVYEIVVRTTDIKIYDASMLQHNGCHVWPARVHSIDHFPIVRASSKVAMKLLSFVHGSQRC